MDPNVNSPLGAWKASPLWRRTQQPSDTDLCHLLIVLSTKSAFSESREVQWYESSRLPRELRSPGRKLAEFWSRNRLEMGQPVTTFSLKRCWWMESDGQWAVTGYEFMCTVGPSATGISGPKEGRNIPTKDVEVDITLCVPGQETCISQTRWPPFAFTSWICPEEDRTKKAGCFPPVHLCHSLATSPGGFHISKMSFHRERQRKVKGPNEHTAAQHWKIPAAAC